MVISVGLNITMVHIYFIRRTCIPITYTGVLVTHRFTGDMQIFHNTAIPLRYTAVHVRCTDIHIIYTAIAVRYTDIPITYRYPHQWY